MAISLLGHLDHLRLGSQITETLHDIIANVCFLSYLAQMPWNHQTKKVFPAAPPHCGH